MNIAYSCDDHYVEQTGISIMSLLENNRDVESICIYLISKNISDTNIRILSDLTNSYNRTLIVLNFDDICYDLNISSTGRHIETIYSKVFFSRIKDLDKVLYIDSDTIVIRNIEDLWNIDLDNLFMGVVETTSIQFKKKLGIPDEIPFFNDGMALINVDYCRKNNLIKKVKQVIDEFNGNPPLLSEGVLNKVCVGKVKYISMRYNLMSGILYGYLHDLSYLSTCLHYAKEDLADSCENPVIIHYLSAYYNRPWCKGCTHPYKDYYTKYKRQSPWKNTPLEDKPLPLKIRLLNNCIQLLGYRFILEIRKEYNKMKLKLQR